MVEEDESDSFLAEFMARARRRDAKLATIIHERAQKQNEDEEEDAPDELQQRHEVSYPALSPLPEESPAPVEPSEVTPADTPNLESKETDDQSYNSDLNYSSDLSLSCETNDELYRAEPIVCETSPESVTSLNRNYHSPKKTTQTSPQQTTRETTFPLQEIQPESKPTSSQSLPSASAIEQNLRDLESKIERADRTKVQLKKAVEVAKYGSEAHIEAARLLQIAELEHLGFTNELIQFKQGKRRRTDCLGSMAISHIRLKMSDKLRNDLAEDGVSHYFFCVASTGADLRVTNLVNTNDIRRQDLKGYVEFKDNLVFADLPPDFFIKLEVYELVTGQHVPKFLTRLTPSKRTKMTLETNFKRVGSLKLKIEDREATHMNLSQFGEREKSMYIQRECRFQLELKPEQLPVKTGMLHVRCLDSDGRPDWTRFWVDSSCGQIRFWRSRQDSVDGKKPNQTLELREICSKTIQKLTPDDDLYRQHSFVLYSYQQLVGGESNTLLQRISRNDPKFKFVKHQLAADSKEERDSWSHILDQSLYNFREWHLDTKTYLLDELKEIFSTY